MAHLCSMYIFDFQKALVDENVFRRRILRGIDDVHCVKVEEYETFTNFTVSELLSLLVLFPIVGLAPICC